MVAMMDFNFRLDNYFVIFISFRLYFFDALSAHFLSALNYVLLRNGDATDGPYLRDVTSGFNVFI